MNKTQKNIIAYVNNTINGFANTLELARKDGWNYIDLARMLDSDTDNVHGALMFANIYEEKISEQLMNELTEKMLDAKSQTIKEFLGIA